MSMAVEETRTENSCKCGDGSCGCGKNNRCGDGSCGCGKNRCNDGSCGCGKLSAPSHFHHGWTQERKLRFFELHLRKAQRWTLRLRVRQRWRLLLRRGLLQVNLLVEDVDTP
eukprot:g8242.t2